MAGIEGREATGDTRHPHLSENYAFTGDTGDEPEPEPEEKPARKPRAKKEDA